MERIKLRETQEISPCRVHQCGNEVAYATRKKTNKHGGCLYAKENEIVISAQEIVYEKENLLQFFYW